MTKQTVSPDLFASIMASRLLHDASGPLSGLVSGLELLTGHGDPEMKDAGLELATASARALTDWLEFCRLAFAGESTLRGGAELARIAAQPFVGRRVRLVWEAGDGPFSGAASRIILLMVLIGAAGLSAGGVVRVTAAEESTMSGLTIEVQGPRITISEEVRRGLDGEAPPAGLAGRWIPARLLHDLVAAADGQFTLSTQSGLLLMTARLPSDGPPSE